MAAAHLAALEQAPTGGCYCLGGENARQMAVYEVVRELTGRELPRRIPDAVAALVGWAEEMRARVTGATPQLTAGTAGILRRDWPLDSSAAVRDLGYRVTPLAEGVRRLIEQAEAGRRKTEQR